MLRLSSKRAVVFLALLLLCVPSAPRAGASGLLQETGTLPYCGDMAFETVNRYFFSPSYAEDSVVFVVATRSTDENWKLYRSEDGGLTWQFNADEYVYDLAFSPSYDVDQTVFAVPYSSEANQSYALRSSDRGVTWQRVFTPSVKSRACRASCSRVNESHLWL